MLAPSSEISTRSLLVARFIGYHVQDGLRPAAPLREAQLWLRDANVAQIRRDLSELETSLSRVAGGREITSQNSRSDLSKIALIY
jgi:hypothetical protein